MRRINQTLAVFFHISELRCSCPNLIPRDVNVMFHCFAVELVRSGVRGQESVQHRALLWLMVDVERGLAQLSVQGQAYQPSGGQND